MSLSGMMTSPEEKETVVEEEERTEPLYSAPALYLATISRYEAGGL